MTDEQYMHLALELAEKGCGFVNPNPMVGAVIVKNGQVIGQGFHEKYGGPHAERNGLASCKVPPEGATLYVTLEPCCHFGKTPPCTEAILESGIGRVVIGHVDPNPLVAGKGAELLRRRGIEVVTGVLEEECGRLNEAFFHYIRTQRPYVVMKYAMTMDGKIATATGKSKWITGETARRRVHRDRSRCMAVMVGVGTVLADDPLLTCRIGNGRNPVRIICDTHLRTPLSSQVVTTARAVPTILATACTDEEKQKPYRSAGCQILMTPETDGHLDLRELMKKLGEEEIDSILLEGGGSLNWSALQSGIVNKVQAYVAPKLFGGECAKTPIAGLGVNNPADAFFLAGTTVTFLGDDILIENEVKPKCSRE